MRVKTKRLQRIESALDSCPLRDDVLGEAFERFRDTGELPEDRRLASAVVRRLLPTDAARAIGDPAAYLLSVMHGRGPVPRAMEPTAADRRPSGTLRDQLLREAVSPEGWMQRAARTAITLLVENGFEITDPYLLDDLEMPDFGTVGLHLLGWPECLVRPPFERQAGQLLDRFAALRQQVDRSDQRWFERMAAGLAAYLRSGDEPRDALMRECVLANAELFQLMNRISGEQR